MKSDALRLSIGEVDGEEPVRAIETLARERLQEREAITRGAVAEAVALPSGGELALARREEA